MSLIKQLLVVALISGLSVPSFAQNSIQRKVVTVSAQRGAAIVQAFDEPNRKTWFEVCNVSHAEMQQTTLGEEFNAQVCEVIGGGPIFLSESSLNTFNHFFNKAVQDHFDYYHRQSTDFMVLGMVFAAFPVVVSIGLVDVTGKATLAQKMGSGFFAVVAIAMVGAAIAYKRHVYNTLTLFEASIEFQMEKNFNEAVANGETYGQRFADEAAKTKWIDELALDQYDIILNSLKWATEQTRKGLL